MKSIPTLESVNRDKFHPNRPVPVGGLGPPGTRPRGNPRAAYDRGLAQGRAEFASP